MRYEQLKELVKFCNSIDSESLSKMVNEAGFLVKSCYVEFIEVTRVVTQPTTARVWVRFIDRDPMSETWGEEAEVVFTYNPNLVDRVVDLDFVQKM